MSRLDDPRFDATQPPILDPLMDLQDVLDSLLSRLDDLQRRAFHQKMSELDSRRSMAADPSQPQATVHHAGWYS